MFTNENVSHIWSLCEYLLLRAFVSSVMSCSTQVQSLTACCSTAFPCGGGCGFCCLCDLDALCCDSFFLIFELKGFLPTVSRCSVLLVVTMATRRVRSSTQKILLLTVLLLYTCCIAMCDWCYLR